MLCYVKRILINISRSVRVRLSVNLSCLSVDYYFVCLSRNWATVVRVRRRETRFSLRRCRSSRLAKPNAVLSVWPRFEGCNLHPRIRVQMRKC